MDLWQLNIFCKVVELKSFSLAGKTVHLSQPTVSSHIKDLEDHFGCRLIDRLAKEAVPTKAGEILYRYANRLMALKDEAETALAEFHGKIKGRLMVGGSTIPGVYILPKMIGAFIQRYPDVTVSLVNGDTEEINQHILEGYLELGVVGAVATDKRILQEKLLQDELRLVVPSGHKWKNRKAIRVEMLFKEPFISREMGSGTLISIQESLNKVGYNLNDLNIVSEMGSTEAVIQGIKSKVGLSILSPIAITEELRTGTLKALAVDGLNLKRNFFLSFPKHRTGSPLGRVFIQFLKDECNGSFLGLPESI
ncbi:MAG: selenium metabolism-associated LysR family transcriptional regulator [Desulfobacterales bacterium]|jgi:DNA-binding transcriptional LysR family regulator|nr:selenium metabolism-associated LysR family transcriptional regulator [Desulfobacterales bacterium]